MVKKEKKQALKIGLVQSKVIGDPERNLVIIASKIQQAVKKGAKIICLQELFNTVYFPQYKGRDPDKYAEAVPGKTSVVFSKLAKKLGVVIVAPIFEKTKNSKYYNTALVIDERGRLLNSYRKTHIPQDPGFYEQEYFAPGDSGYKVYKTKFATFAVLICYDQWFPEAARMSALAGAELIFYPTAIGHIRGYKPPEGDWHDAWETIMRGHAIANSVHVAAVNRVGREGKLDFWGQTFVCNSFGKVIKKATAHKEEVLIAEIDLSANKQIRDSWGFFHNRRPATYKL